MAFRDVLNSGKFVVTAEIGLPKGTDIFYNNSGRKLQPAI